MVNSLRVIHHGHSPWRTPEGDFEGVSVRNHPHTAHVFRFWFIHFAYWGERIVGARIQKMTELFCHLHKRLSLGFDLILDAGLILLNGSTRRSRHFTGSHKSQRFTKRCQQTTSSSTCAQHEGRRWSRSTCRTRKGQS